MNKKEKIEWLKVEKEIVDANEIVDCAYDLNLPYMFFLVNEKDRDWVVFKCKDWEIESQAKYFENRKEMFKKGYTTEITFNKRKINSVTKYAI